MRRVGIATVLMALAWAPGAVAGNPTASAKKATPKPKVTMPKLCKKGWRFAFAECRKPSEAKQLRADFDDAAIKKQVASAEAAWAKADTAWKAGGSVKGSPRAVAAAKAALDVANLQWERFIGVDLPVKDANGKYSVKRLRISIRALSDGLKRAQGALKKVTPYGDPASTACARYHSATLVEVMSEAIANAPLPSGLTPAHVEAYRQAINGYVLPLREQALRGYRFATKVAGAKGGCVDAAHAGVKRLTP